MKNPKSNWTTILGYIASTYNALVTINLDKLDYTLPSTYLTLFGLIVMPIIMGHSTEFKGSK